MLRPVSLIMLLLLPASLWASPVYTRQTGAACRLCHYADMRSLNAYGRAFLVNGYNETAQMIEERREYEDKQSGQSAKFANRESFDGGTRVGEGTTEEGADAGTLSEDWELDMVAPPDDGLPGRGADADRLGGDPADAEPEPGV